MIVKFRAQQETAGRLAYEIHDDRRGFELANPVDGQDFDWGPRAYPYRQQQLAYVILVTLGADDEILGNDLGDAFAAELLAAQPADGFELHVDVISCWLRRHGLILRPRYEIVSSRAEALR